jgi:eukaryotic-like serine/threonine-protein kinase
MCAAVLDDTRRRRATTTAIYSITVAPRTSKEGPSVDDDTEVTTRPAPEIGDVTAMTAPIELPDTQLKTGMTLGDYRVERLIGQGGMGVVYAAVHPLIGKRAAVKILKKELCTDAGTLERFIDEARVVNEIGHPNIVDVFAFGEMPDGRSFFVMELLSGETLRTRLARAPLTLPEIIDIVRPLARALTAAHGKGVVHRDLKPDNIFLVASGEERPTVKLLDFGVAKLARSDHRLEKTATGAMVGTPQYIAPEQAKGYSIDHRADIYSLGGILFEMITRRPPFVADNAMEVVAKHLMEPPVRPSTLVADVPEPLDTIVVRMLAKDPAARPTLAELVTVIDRMRASTATGFPALAARPASSGIEHTAPVRKRRMSPLPFAIAGALVTAAAMFFIVRSLTRNEPTPTQAVTTSEATSPEVAAATPAPVAEAPAAPVPAPVAEAPTEPKAPSPPPKQSPPPKREHVVPAPVQRPRPRVVETRPAKGHVKLVANHAAKFSIDGVPVGEGASVEIDLSPGVHKLVVEAAGFVKLVDKLVVERGDTMTKRVRLQPALDPDKQLLEPGQLGGQP